MMDIVKFPNLLEDLQNFGRNNKAHSVYNKCMRAHKYSLAQRIAKKYNIKEDDVTLSMRAAMLSIKKGTLYPCRFLKKIKEMISKNKAIEIEKCKDALYAYNIYFKPESKPDMKREEWDYFLMNKRPPRQTGHFAAWQAHLLSRLIINKEIFFVSRGNENNELGLKVIDKIRQIIGENQLEVHKQYATPPSELILKYPLSYNVEPPFIIELPKKRFTGYLLKIKEI